ncbi:MAG: hypothetical protein IPJ61_21440 [Tessaracoccus sp.]|uniref:hypothetical protein n=1 Tax=Tessaracoccus sp. TaxID=1971211 RepID=UPI001EBE55E9|nr:hypothetical protein [Tessaracoccus sp.]MBK7823553.1 hypothetical protein [Tessaracoccus sp.]
MAPEHVSAKDYKEFAAKTKDADKELAREIRKELRDLGRADGDQILNEGVEPLPHGGGLAAWIVATAKVTVSITGTRLEFALGMKAKDLIPRLDAKGILRHPVWGRPERTRKEWGWANQEVKGHTWSDAFMNHKDEMVTGMSTAVENALRRLK